VVSATVPTRRSDCEPTPQVSARFGYSGPLPGRSRDRMRPVPAPVRRISSRCRWPGVIPFSTGPPVDSRAAGCGR